MMSEVTVEQVRDALKNCYDPEIPLNVVDLGLIYDINIQGENVHVKMTLTAPGCPMHTFLSESVKNELLKVKGVKNAEVEIIWDPPWSPDRMSPEAKRQLGMDTGVKLDEENMKPKKEGNVLTQPDGATVLVTPSNATFKVSPEVVEIWEICDGTKTINEIVDIFAAKTNMQQKDLKPQILELMGKLVNAGLLA